LLNCSGDLDNSNDNDADCAADGECDIELHNAIKDPQCPQPRDVNATRNVLGRIRPTRKLKRQSEKVLVMFNAIETRRNMEVKKQSDTMCQCFTSIFVYDDQEFQLEIYYGRIVSNSL